MDQSGCQSPQREPAARDPRSRLFNVGICLMYAITIICVVVPSLKRSFLLVSEDSKFLRITTSAARQFRGFPSVLSATRTWYRVSQPSGSITSARYQISDGRGMYPLWSSNRHELFYETTITELWSWTTVWNEMSSNPANHGCSQTARSFIQVYRTLILQRMASVLQFSHSSSLQAGRKTQFTSRCY
jgi:hypothetical protein